MVKNIGMDAAGQEGFAPQNVDLNGPAVVAVEALQAKSRWLADVDGYCPPGFRVRKKLRMKAGKWGARSEGVCHVTLTYDPWKWIEKPEGWAGWSDDDKAFFYSGPKWQAMCKQAYLDSRRRRHVAEFVRRLRAEIGDFEWFRVLEFQENGQIHFHVLMTRDWISHAKLVRLWRHGYAFVRPVVDKTFGYLTKYLTKGVDAPQWLHEFSPSLRMTSAARGFWDEVGFGRRRIVGEVEAVAGDDDGHASGSAAAAGVGDRHRVVPRVMRRRLASTIGEVMAQPMKHVKSMLRIVLETGEEVHRLGTMNLLTTVHIFNVLGLMGGCEPGSLGRASFMPVPGLRISLDQLLHCGRGWPPPE